MALEVESGSGSSTAESYESVENADLYVAAYEPTGKAAWDAIVGDGPKEVALRKATQALDARFGLRWMGQRKTSSQALDWPRFGLIDSDGKLWSSSEIPTQLKHACIELAVRHANGDVLVPDVAVGGNVKKQKVKAGEVESEKEFFGSKRAGKTFAIANKLLSKFTHPAGRIFRA